MGYKVQSDMASDNKVAADSPSRQQHESFISPGAAGEPRRAGICAPPSMPRESSCRSSVAEWQQQVNWGQLTYVPVVNGVTPQRQCQVGNAAPPDGHPSKFTRTCSSSVVPSINTYEGMHALVVPCWGPAKSAHSSDQQQQPTPGKDSGPGAGWSSALHTSQRIVQDMVASLSLLKYSSPAAAVAYEPAQQQTDDKGLELDSGNASELQLMVAAMQLHALFGSEASKPSGEPEAAAAEPSQQIDSLTPVHLGVPYEQVTGVGLCYTGRY